LKPRATDREGVAAPGSDASPPGAPAPELVDDVADADALRLAFETLLGLPFTSGNRVEPLRNGDEIFPAMLEAIGAARESVHLLTFVYWQGAVARRFAEVLAERARAGVRVRVLLDDVGCLPISAELVEAMTSAGVEVRRFRKVGRVRWRRIENRTHRKVLVCDGRIGFTGGVGIAEEWEGDARNPDEWRDTHFRVEGPAVRGLDGAFFDNWLEECGRLDEAAPPVVDLRPGTTLVQTIRSSGLPSWTDCSTAARVLIRHARRRLRIQTAYFVPDDAIRDELCAARARGVEVEIMLPGRHSDHRLCNLAGRAQYQPLLDAGIRLLLYEHTMLHAKVATVDGLLSFVGSPNFNQRSARRDDEIALVLLDRELTAALDDDFDADLEHCCPIDPETWPRRGPWARTKEFLASFLRSRL
jgi:cardiolipin synthase